MTAVVDDAAVRALADNRGVELVGRGITLRPVVDGDVAALREIVRHPEIARWWSAPESFADMLAIARDGEVIGAIEYHEEDDPDYRHAGIDVFLDPAWRGRGLGTEAVRTLARWLIEERAHHRLTIDPAADNVAAIRSYEKVGFRRVGVLREYERSQLTGEWHDGLLMDLLADELT